MYCQTVNLGGWWVGRKKNLPLHVHFDCVIILLMALNINPLELNDL